MDYSAIFPTQLSICHTYIWLVCNISDKLNIWKKFLEPVNSPTWCSNYTISTNYSYRVLFSQFLVWTCIYRLAQAVHTVDIPQWLINRFACTSLLTFDQSVVPVPESGGFLSLHWHITQTKAHNVYWIIFTLHLIIETRGIEFTIRFLAR